MDFPKKEHKYRDRFLALIGAFVGVIAFFIEKLGYIDNFTRSVEYFAAGHMSGFYSSLIVLGCALIGGSFGVYAIIRSGLIFGIFNIIVNSIVIAYHSLTLLINY